MDINIIFHLQQMHLQGNNYWNATLFMAVFKSTGCAHRKLFWSNVFIVLLPTFIPVYTYLLLFAKDKLWIAHFMSSIQKGSPKSNFTLLKKIFLEECNYGTNIPLRRVVWNYIVVGFHNRCNWLFMIRNKNVPETRKYSKVPF